MREHIDEAPYSDELAVINKATEGKNSQDKYKSYATTISQLKNTQITEI